MCIHVYMYACIQVCTVGSSKSEVKIGKEECGSRQKVSGDGIGGSGNVGGRVATAAAAAAVAAVVGAAAEAATERSSSKAVAEQQHWRHDHTHHGNNDLKAGTIMRILYGSNPCHKY